MFVYRLVYVVHQAHGFGQRRDDALVRLEVGVGELAAFAIFEPLFADLIAADVELPDLRRYALEVLRGVNPDAALLRALARRGVAHLFHRIIAPYGVARHPVRVRL